MSWNECSMMLRRGQDGSDCCLPRKCDMVVDWFRWSSMQLLLAPLVDRCTCKIAWTQLMSLSKGQALVASAASALLHSNQSRLSLCGSWNKPETPLLAELFTPRCGQVGVCVWMGLYRAVSTLQKSSTCKLVRSVN